MKKISRGYAIALMSVLCIMMFVLIAYVCSIKFAGDLRGDVSPFHTAINSFLILVTIGLIVWTVVEAVNYAEAYNTYESFLDWISYNPKDENKMSDSDNTSVIKFKPWKWILYILLTIGLFQIKGCYNSTKTVYNKSRVYHNQYEQKTQEKMGFYDKMWKSYLQKTGIASVNRETFIMVAKIIMENRVDGKNVVWKWVQENQNIPFETFSNFYADLSIFITEQREGYFNIEKACQTIANSNNTLLDTFPNNVINKVLRCDKISFSYGFLSDSTNNVFKNKIENLR